ALGAAARALAPRQEPVLHVLREGHHGGHARVRALPPARHEGAMGARHALLRLSRVDVLDVRTRAAVVRARRGPGLLPDADPGARPPAARVPGETRQTSRANH